MFKEDLNSLSRKLRIFSGVILFAYVLMHLLNHSVNVISIEAADFIRENYFRVVWQNPIGLTFLYGSLIVHMILGFYSILIKKSFKLKGIEWIQILFPVLALLLLLQHIAASFIITKIFGGEETYKMLFSAMHTEPDELIVGGVLFSLMTIFIWVHGAIGINAFLKQQARHHNRFGFYLKYPFTFKFIFWFVPIVAVLGFLSGLREMSFLSYLKSLEKLGGDKNFLFSNILEVVPEEALPVVMQIEPIVMNNYPLLVLVVILIATFNVVRAKYFGRILINYPGGIQVSIAKGTTVLEASRLAKIPHQSVCGGKGRCTTCRIKVLSHEGDIEKPSLHEIKAIERVGLDDNVRLACQLRPSNNMSVLPLLNPKNQLETVRSARALTGKEQETVILFVDLRDFTKLSEKKLPYDVVYILNKYYAVCGEIIERNGGRLDKFIGDGIMAIFDSSDDVGVNCKNSVMSASEISKNMKTLNSEMKVDFEEEMRFGMGLHAGNTIVGMMGYGKTVSETAVGDNVNVASRLEELTKTYKCELVISKYVAEKAKLDIDKLISKAVDVRGRKESLEIYAIEDASEYLV